MASARLDHLAHLAQFQRLEQVVVGAELHGLDGVVGVAVAADEDDRTAGVQVRSWRSISSPVRSGKWTSSTTTSGRRCGPVPAPRRPSRRSALQARRRGTPRRKASRMDGSSSTINSVGMALPRNHRATENTENTQKSKDEKAYPSFLISVCVLCSLWLFLFHTRAR